ncbi:hypothetical protein IE53DRAFT_371686, partial [Violaceomyces palustris]
SFWTFFFGKGKAKAETPPPPPPPPPTTWVVPVPEGDRLSPPDNGFILNAIGGGSENGGWGFRSDPDPTQPVDVGGVAPMFLAYECWIGLDVTPDLAVGSVLASDLEAQDRQQDSFSTTSDSYPRNWSQQATTQGQAQQLGQTRRRRRGWSPPPSVPSCPLESADDGAIRKDRRGERIPLSPREDLDSISDPNSIPEHEHASFLPPPHLLLPRKWTGGGVRNPTRPKLKKYCRAMIPRSQDATVSSTLTEDRLEASFAKDSIPLLFPPSSHPPESRLDKYLPTNEVWAKMQVLMSKQEQALRNALVESGLQVWDQYQSARAGRTLLAQQAAEPAKDGGLMVASEIAAGIAFDVALTMLIEFERG